MNGKRLEFIILESCNMLKDDDVRKAWLNLAALVAGYTSTTWSNKRRESMRVGPAWKPKVWRSPRRKVP